MTDYDKLIDLDRLSAFKDKADDEYQAKLVSGTSIKTVNGNSLLGSGDISVQPTLVSGTNIKTINGDSLLGSGDLAVGGSVTMEDTAVDAAVEAAFPAPTGYAITPIGQASPDAVYRHCNGIGTTDSFASGTYVSTADAGTTIYVALDNDYEPVVTRTDTSATLTYSLYGPGAAGKLWTFIMPEADVTVDVFYND